MHEPPLGVLDMIAVHVHGRAKTEMLCACRRSPARPVFEQDVAEWAFSASVAARLIADGGRKDVDHDRRPL